MRTTSRLDRYLHCTRRATFLVRFFFGSPSKLINGPDQKENCHRDNQKVNGEGHEVPVIPRDSYGFRRVDRCIEHDVTVFGSSQYEELVRKIEPAGEETDWRHDYVFDQ